MPRMGSTTSSGTPIPGGGMTLDALMARQKELADRQATLMQPNAGSGTIAGGLGQMANSLFTGLAARKARNQEAEGRTQLTQLLAGINPDTGATPEQWSAISALSPEIGLPLMSDAIKSRRDLANRESFSTLTPEEEIAAGLDPAGTYQRSSTSHKIDPIGGAGQQITIDNAGDKKWSETGAAKFGERVDAYASEGVAAKQQLNQINQLEFLMRDMPTGLDAVAVKYLRDNWGIAVGEGSDKLQAFDAIISKMVPSQRPAGSGTMSDRDIDLFKSSLPSHLNTPEGNAMVLATMRGIAEYNAQMGAIADQAMQMPDVGQARAFFTSEVNKLQDPMAAWRKAEVQRQKAEAGGGGGAPGGGGGAKVEDMPDGTQKVTLEDGTVVIRKPRKVGP